LLDSHKNIANISNHFIPGIQSVSIDEGVPGLFVSDIGRVQEAKRINTPPSHSISIERVLSSVDKLWLEKSSENLWNSANFTGANQYRNSFLLKPENFGMVIPGFSTGTKAAIQQKILPEYTLKAIYAPENNSVIGSSGLSGTALDIIEMPYCLLSRLSYSFTNEGAFKENIELSSKVLKKSDSNSYSFDTRGGDSSTSTSTFARTLTRENFDISLSVLPSTIENLVSSNKYVNGVRATAITNIETSVSFEYQQMQDTGQLRGASDSSFDELNLFTTLRVPVEVSCRFTLVAARSQQSNIKNIDTNFSNERICLVMKVKNQETSDFRFFVFNLGNRNRLVSISESGGDTSGSLVEYTFEYININDFVTYTQLQADSTTLNPSLFQQTTENY
jgi:hypothetical protein